VDEELLVAHVANLSREQASEMIQDTQERLDNELNKGVTLSEAMRMIGWVKGAVEKIGSKLEEILAEEHAEKAALVRERDGDGDSASADAGGGVGDVGGNENRGRDEDDAPVLALTAPATDAAGLECPDVPEADARLKAIQERMIKIEAFLQEALQYTTFRGKDFRNRLAVIEDLVRSQRDATMLKVERDVWDQAPPQLGGSNNNANMPFTG
jgi:hypothetical protein